MFIVYQRMPQSRTPLPPVLQPIVMCQVYVWHGLAPLRPYSVVVPIIMDSVKLLLSGENEKLLTGFTPCMLSIASHKVPLGHTNSKIQMQYKLGAYNFPPRPHGAVRQLGYWRHALYIPVLKPQRPLPYSLFSNITIRKSFSDTFHMKLYRYICNVNN